MSRYSSTSNPFSRDYDASRYGGYAPNRTYDGFPESINSYTDSYGQRYPENYQPYYTARIRDRQLGYDATSDHRTFNNYQDLDIPHGEGSSSRQHSDREEHPSRPSGRSHSFSYVRNSLRGAFSSDGGSRSNHYRHDTTPYEPRNRHHGETIQPQPRATIYTTPRRRDVFAVWFSRGGDHRRDSGRNDQGHGTNEDEECRRVRHRGQPNEQSRSRGFYRGTWFSR